MNNGKLVITILYESRDFLDHMIQLATGWLQKNNWSIQTAHRIDDLSGTEDLIIAEERFFFQMRENDSLWNRSIFVSEENMEESDLTVNEMPFIVWRYEAIGKIERRIVDALNIVTSVAGCSKSHGIHGYNARVASPVNIFDFPIEGNIVVSIAKINGGSDNHII